MMRNNILLSFVFSVFVFFSWAQPPCGANPAAGETCATATPICELNGYCGNTTSYSPDSWGTAGAVAGCGFLGLSPCPGTGMADVFCGSIENDSYLSFTAAGTTIAFDVWVTSSVWGDGIQLIVYNADECDQDVVTSLYCEQILPNSGNATNVSLTGLTPGQAYHIMIDGFAGDQCDYTIGADTGIAIPIDITPSNSTVCIGESVNLTATGGDGTYIWDTNSDLSTTSGNQTTATPTAAGSYTYYCNSATGNPLCPSSTIDSAVVVVSACGCTVTTANTGPVCSPETFNLTASDVTDATAYSWTGPNGFTSSDQNPTGISGVSGDYTVVVSSPSGDCQSTTTVTVNSLPTVDGNDVTICGNSSITLNGSGAITYVWSDGVTDGASFLSSGTHTYTVTGTDANGCTNTGDAEVVVNSLPTVDGNDETVCFGDSVTLNGTGAVTYTWDNGVLDGETFLPLSTQTYTVTGISANNCENTGQVEVVVNSLPTVDAGTYQSICNGENVMLSATGADTYSWDNGVTDAVSFTPSATTLYTVIGTDANGCINSDTVTVIVNPNIPVNAGLDTTICIGASAVLNAIGTPTVVWTSGELNGASVSPGTTTVYEVTGTSSNGCVTTDEMTVFVNPLPIIDAGTDATICEGDNFILSASGGVTYVWDNGVSDNVSFTPSNSATYTVTGTDANGCVNTSDVTVTLVPVPTAIVDGSPVSGISPLTVNFTNSSTDANAYSWDFGNGDFTTVNTLADQSTTYNTPGTFTTTLTASNGICATEDTITIVVLPLAPPVVTPPNVFTPNGDNTNDHYFVYHENVASIKVQIFNRWGALMYEYDTLNGYWDGNVKGKQAAQGTYFYKFQAVGLNGDEIDGHGFLELILN